MPIVEIEVVCHVENEFKRLSTKTLANALGQVFGSQSGTVWVKLRLLSATGYAENDATLEASELPAFVSVLHAHMPQDEKLASEAVAITNAVALCLGRSPQRVHVRYDPSAAGRQAFGGNVVR